MGVPVQQSEATHSSPSAQTMADCTCRRGGKEGRGRNGKENECGASVGPSSTDQHLMTFCRCFLWSSENTQGGRMNVVHSLVCAALSSQERKHKQQINLSYFLINFTESNLETLLQS